MPAHSSRLSNAHGRTDELLAVHYVKTAPQRSSSVHQSKAAHGAQPATRRCPSCSLQRG
jgi:hypothetical protein